MTNKQASCIKSKGYNNSSDVLRELKDLYIKDILPVEQATEFHALNHGALSEGDFASPPMLLVIGPYSAGKTTFIEYLLGKPFPGGRVGPEPTTDSFCAIINGENERMIPGNALTITPGSQFHGLQKFGNDFLTRFYGAEVSSCEVAKGLTIIDSPGVLSGEKQTLGRSYDYTDVVNWFAERSDMIICFFDVNKCEISDEMSSSIKALYKFSDKVKVVLNKCDSVDTSQNLMKIYGALLWSLGRIIKTPEVVKIYAASFWNKPLQNEETRRLIETEVEDLLNDINEIPRLSAVRKLNDMVTRLRLLLVHTIILDCLRCKMTKFKKQEQKKKLMNDLPSIFSSLMKSHELSPGDFPDLNRFRKFLNPLDFSKLPKLTGTRMQKGKRIDKLNCALATDIPDLLARLP